MSFMQPEIFEDDYYAVECNHGETNIVPADVISHGTIPRDVPIATLNGDLADYCEGSPDDPDEPCELKHGWLCRLQAPGYMDSTEWSAFDTEREAIDFVLDFYGTQDDGPREDWEIPLELRRLELDGLQRFECVEHSSGFNVTDRITGESHGMSDGVDVDFGTEDSPLTVGMEGFREAWEASLNENQDETLEAYFPEQFEREND